MPESRKHLFLILICILLGGFSSAQQNVSSPYSRYAFGELNNNGLAAYSGWGFSSVALADSFLINISNPASFANIMPHRPIFDIGVGGMFVQSSSQNTSETSNAIGLRNITLAFPINQRSGFSFGIVPFSSVGYNMKSVVAEENIGDVTYSFKGEGGINRLYLGGGYKIVNAKRHTVSLGVRGSYLFGNILRERKAVFPAYTGILNTKVKHNTIVSDFLADFGLQYKMKIKDSIQLSVGIAYNLGADINARQEMLAYSFRNTSTEYPLDTIQYIDTISGYMSFPTRLSAGFAYEVLIPRDKGLNRRLVITGQYDMQNWSQYAEVFGGVTVDDQLKNSSGFGFGIQYTPLVFEKIPEAKIWQTASYRIGYRSYSTYLQLNNTQLKQNGISFGLGLPLLNSRSLSMLNIGGEIGNKGTTENNLLEERYFNLYIGISVSPSNTDGWFHKRKYD